MPEASLRVPFFRVDLSKDELDAVADVLRSGWLTSGPRAREFEGAFAAAVGAGHAIAVNSGTAALHLAVEALGLRPPASPAAVERLAVLVPTLTFAATAEVVRYQGAVPVLVDCDPVTLNLDLGDAERRLDDLANGRLADRLGGPARAVGILPVHVGGLMLDADAVRAFARRHRLWVVEDAAHAFPAAWREAAGAPWRQAGAATADVTCFSFYANKTITTGEGGMAVTGQADLADRMRVMALHGLSKDAWARYSGEGSASWDYRIVAPGYKYNLTDIAAALGLAQLAKAEAMRLAREEVARRYLAELASEGAIELPPDPPDRIHAWHLFPVRLRLDRLAIDRPTFLAELHQGGVGFSVHWRPLHLHPYYQETFGWKPEDFPVATRLWERLVSLPIFPSMREEEVAHVVDTVRGIARRHRR